MPEISKIEINDTVYELANESADVEQLKADVIEIRSNINDLDTHIDDVENVAESARATASELFTDVADLKVLTDEHTIDIATNTANIATNATNIETNRDTAERALNKATSVETGIINLLQRINAIESDMYYQAGDGLDVSIGSPILAFITSSLKSIYITVPVRKNLKNINTVNVSTLNVLLKSHLGNVNGDNPIDYANTEGYTISSAIIRDYNMVRIIINSTNPFTNVSASEPLTVSTSNSHITLSFS